MLRWIGKTQLSTCRQTSLNGTCMEIETAGRHDVTVDRELTRHSLLPADRQAETGTASRQNVTVNGVDTVFCLQTDKM